MEGHDFGGPQEGISPLWLASLCPSPSATSSLLFLPMPPFSPSKQFQHGIHPQPSPFSRTLSHGG